MRRMLVLAALGVMAAAVADVSQAQPDQAGFVSLFNGKDLTGWKLLGSKSSDWSVANGILTARTTTRGWLMTEGQYDDFELRLEYRVSAKGNSGVTFRATLDGNPTANNVEVQILDDAGYPDLKASQYTGAVYNIVPRSRRASKGAGEWNEMGLTVKGRQLTVMLNGTQIVDADLDAYKDQAGHPGLMRGKGHIGLQSWDGTIDFRNVRIKTQAGATVVRPADGAEKPVLVLNEQGHTDSIPTAMFTPRGDWLISVSKDKTVRVWDVRTGEIVRVFRLPLGVGRAGTLYAGAISPDGRTLAVGGIGLRAGEANVYLISLASGQIEHTLRGHRDLIQALAFSSDGKQLVSGSQDGDARVWKVENAQTEHVLQGHRNGVRGVAFAPDGKRVVTASFDGTARLWSAATGKSESVLSLERDGKTYTGISAAWSADGKTVAIGCGDFYVRLFSSNGQPGERLGPFGDAVLSVAFVPRTRELLVVTGFDQKPTCSLVNIDTGKERLRFSKHTTCAWGCALSLDGSLAVTGGFEGEELYVWKTADGSIVHRLGGQGRTTWSAGWSADGKTLAWGNTGKRSYNNTHHPLERTFQIEDLQFGGKPSGEFQRGQPERDGFTLQRRPGKVVAVMERANPISTLTTPSFPTSFAMLPGARAVVTDLAGGLYLFDARTGKELRSLQGHTGDVWAAAPSPDGRYLLSASSDQTLRVWSPEKSDPLLSLFASGHDWIVWTPEGYYAASPGGENLMGWQVNNGPDKLATFHPAAQFRKTFYRPDVIKKLLEAGSVEKALTLADQERGQQSVRTEVAQVLPPTVAITFPEKSGQKITTTKFEVKTSAASVGSQPVTSLRLLVDGRPYGGEASLRTVRSAKVGEVRDSWQVDLPPGPHRLAVVAASAVSQSVSDEIEIFVSPTTATKPPTANLHLLAVGINAYPGRLKLDCAVPDAKGIAGAFANHSKGLYQIKSTLLLDKEATRANLLKGIAALEKQAKAGDVVVMYFAGHGDCKLAGQFVMLTIDATVSRDKLAQTGVTGDEVKARLARLPCTVLLIMDCCYAGSFDAPAKDAGKKKRALPTEAGDLVRELVNDDHGLVVMCGASKEQESGEEAKLGHGYFTKSLIEGLGGKAASKRDGVVYLTGLQLYVEERVRELSSDEQYPTIGKPTLIRSFPLSKP